MPARFSEPTILKSGEDPGDQGGKSALFGGTLGNKVARRGFEYRRGSRISEEFWSAELKGINFLIAENGRAQDGRGEREDFDR